MADQADYGWKFFARQVEHNFDVIYRTVLHNDVATEATYPHMMGRCQIGEAMAMAPAFRLNAHSKLQTR